MKKRYTHIFFDLDDTLWDFYANANETLVHLHEKYKLGEYEMASDDLLEAFHLINNELWAKYQNNLIDKDYLRNSRFELVFKKMKNELFTEHLDFSREYMALCPTKPNLVDGATEVLDYLKEKYPLFVITNGFDEVAKVKLESSGIGHYFKEIITSERAQSKKPDRRIFDYALHKAGAVTQTSIMIGNDPDADIGGARNMGIDQVFFNPNRMQGTTRPTYEILSLRALMDIL